MRQSKFLQLLKSLDKKEQREFGNYLNGLYTGHKTALKLYKHIVKYSPAFDSEKLSKGYVLKRVLHRPLEQSKRIFNELHKLIVWLEDFLLWKRLKNKRYELERQKLLIGEYRERKLDSFFYKKIEAAKQNIEHRPSDINRYVEFQQLLHQQYYYSPTSKLGKRDEIVEQALHCIEWYATLYKLKYTSELRSRANILQEDFTGMPWQSRSKWPEYKVFKDDLLLLNFLQKLYQLTEEPSPKMFCELKAFFLSSGSKVLAIEERLILLSYLINYTAGLIKEGEKTWLTEAFELYQYAAEELIITEDDGYITEAKFHNIVSVACGLEEFEWASDFIKMYRDKLTAKWRRPAVKLAQARIAFGKRDFPETLALLSKTRDKDHAYALHVKMLQIRCFYELGSNYEEVLYSSLSAFETFLKRHKTFNRQTIDSCKNFLKILKQLLRQQDSKESLRSKLESQKPIFCKDWLFEKVESYASR